MRANDVAEVRSALHFSGRENRSPYKRLDRHRGTCKVAKGAYLDLDVIKKCATKWEKRERAMMARILAVAHHFHSEVIFSHDTALFLHRVQTRRFCPDVWCRVSPGYGKRTVFPAVEIDGEQILQAGKVHVTTAAEVTEPVECFGLKVSGLSQLLLECAVTDDFEALTRTSSVLSTFASIRTPYRDERTLFADDVKERATKEILAYPWKRRPRKALRLIAQASGQCESIAECALYSTLVKALSPVQRDELKQQYHVRVAGKEYFLDFALTALRVGFEVEGLGKNAIRGYSPQEAHQAYCDRVNDIESEGWKVYPLTAKECLYEPGETRMKVLDMILRRLTLRLEPTFERKSGLQAKG